MGTMVISVAAFTSLGRASSRLSSHLSTTKMAPVQVGDAVPNVDLFEGAPDQKVNLAEVCKEGKVVIFGVPGAFTPGCSKTHLPGYVEDAEKLKAKGIKDIICVSVNDPFVMGAWGKDQKADGKVRMLADTCGALTKAWEIGLEKVAPVLGNVRCKRFSMVTEGGKVTQVNIEEDGTGHLFTRICLESLNIITKLTDLKCKAKSIVKKVTFYEKILNL